MHVENIWLNAPGKRNMEIKVFNASFSVIRDGVFVDM